ncbi:MAG: DUF1700 domain-containing protein [Clostridia bacterium]|nr:DUF1700 domain-containing protein [Clostridia bacterium]
MCKQTFLAALRQGLAGLPQNNIEEWLLFYSEMIDDRMEDGLSEKEAVAAMGPAEEVAALIIEEFPLAKLVRERVKPKRAMPAWGIVLLVLGSPVWFFLLVAAAAVLLSLYISLWAVVISLWATGAALVGGAFGGVVAAVVLMLQGNVLTALAMLGAGLFLAGLSIFLSFGCKAASRGAVLLVKKAVSGTKSLLMGKERAGCAKQ